MSAVLAAVLLPLLLLGQGGERVIDVRAMRPPGGNSFESLWSAYKKAEARGDTEAAQSAMREIRRLRIERNVHGLETLALAKVAEGLEALRAGEGLRAEAAFRDAIALDPHLPDAHFALAQYESKKGPVGILAATRHMFSGTTARLGTARGRQHLSTLLVPVVLLALLATTVVFALAMVLRYAALLKHDFEESFGPGRQSLALGLCALILLLPAILFQGWAWLPLWWLAMLFIYMGWAERVASLVLLVVCIATAPLVKALESRLLAYQNPLLWASLGALETGADARAVALLERAQSDAPEDLDLVYLLGTEYKKAGRYDEAASLYRTVLRPDGRTAKDRFALNNLANLEFAAGEFPAAIARYKQGIESGPPPSVAATFYYNLSLAHLQRFEYQPAQEAKSQADRLDSSLVRDYDRLWKYDKGDYAVVDLRPSRDEVWAKFAGASQGVVQQNVAGREVGPSTAVAPSLLNRLTVFPLVGAVAVLLLRRWRGSKGFTMRCVKCGTPFCRRCHLGKVAGGLCTQCHHLFVVRDGVSGPARNRKLLEVQKEEAARDRVFRVLSLLVPGMGQLYASNPALGIVLVFVWSAVLAAALLAGRLLPLSETSGELARPWLGLAAGGVLLLAAYVVANRVKPDFDVAIPMRRAPMPAAARRRAS